MVGYLGPNGSGKTTTGRMLTGLMEPSSGAVLFGGRSIGDDPVAYRRRLGYVPEEPALYSFLSGREQLQLIGRLREIPEEERSFGTSEVRHGIAPDKEARILAAWDRTRRGGVSP